MRARRGNHRALRGDRVDIISADFRAAARFNISNETVVRHWLNIYKDAGEKGLLSIKRGRNKPVTTPKKTSSLTDAELEKLSPDELRAELRYLWAEDACLNRCIESQRKMGHGCHRVPGAG